MWGAVEAAGFDRWAGPRARRRFGHFPRHGARGPGHRGRGGRSGPGHRPHSRRLHPQAKISAESFAVTRFPEGGSTSPSATSPLATTSCSTPSTTGPVTRSTTISSPRACRSPRPGGYVAVLTSRFTLDARTGRLAGTSPNWRTWWARSAYRRAQCNGWRGPGWQWTWSCCADREAGEPGTARLGSAWPRVPTPDGPVQVNEVFSAHPGWVLGELRSAPWPVRPGRPRGATFSTGPLAPRLGGRP